LGLVNDLTQNLGCSLAGASILLLGAGGAVRGVIQPLLEAGCSELVIANRTPEKAQQLALHFAETAGPSVILQACGYAEIPVKAFDVIINGTSASLQGDLPPLPEGIVGAHTLCYDMMYSAKPTAFCRWASGQGAARAVDGLGMLVEQAAEAFFRWRERRPDTAPVIALLRQSLAQQ
jgi:shikimate dehydrogenase